MDNSPYKAVPVSDRFWVIEEEFVRSFVLEGDERVLLVDTGLGKGNIKDFVESLCGKPVFVLITHSDGDHVGCNALFDEIYMHPAEFSSYAAKGFDTSTIEPIWEGDVIDLGNRVLEVIHIPGHTPGSIALLDRENRFIITGDPVQDGAIYMFGNARDINAYIASIDKLLTYSDAFDTIYPSHGTLALKPDILPKLAEAAKRLRDGQVEGVPAPYELPCELFDCGVAKFLYNRRKTV